MLTIIIPAVEEWDEEKEEFVYTREHKLQLEHSLVSLSKWESKWEKPFLDNKEKTVEETIDYIRCMTITQNVDPNIYRFISNDNIEKVKKYIDASMTATWFSDEKGGKGGKSSGEIPTSELIYYWMISLNIPFECQKWHLNRLLTLIRVCDVKNKPPKKMSQKSVMQQYSALNAARRSKLKSKG